MNIPGIIEVCTKDKGERDRICSKLNGVWLSSKHLAVRGPDGRDFLFGDNVILSKVLGIINFASVPLFGYLVDRYQPLTQNRMFRGGACRDPRVVAVFDFNKDRDRQPPKVLSTTNGMSGGMTSRLKYTISAAPADLCGGYNEFYIVQAVQHRSVLGYYLPALVRELSRMNAGRLFNRNKVLEIAAQLGTPMTQAILKLALSEKVFDFKSSRFKPRHPVEVNERVKTYYDSPNGYWNSGAQKNNLADGKVVQIGSGSNAGQLLVAANGVSPEWVNYGRYNQYQVWPEKVIPRPLKKSPFNWSE